MKKITNKIFISIMTAVLAVIALGSTTLAWFTLNNVATISNFNASITAGEGIEMSLDGNEWQTILTQTDMETYLSTEYPSFKFSAVTSTNGLTNFLKINGTNTAFEIASLTSESGGADADYITFKVYFRSISGSVNITWTGATLTSTPADWTPDASFISSIGATIAPVGGVYTPISINAADAARISIDGDGTSDFIYEPLQTLTGKMAVEGDLTSGTNSRGAVSYYQGKNQGTSPFEAATVTIPNNLDGTTLSSPNNGVVLTGVDVSGTDFITIRVWMEGWDPDCYNAVLNRQLTIGLIFTKVS